MTLNSELNTNEKDTRKEMKEILNSINRNTYIISDLHLGHKNIVRFEPEREELYIRDGFDNQEDWLIHNWNSTISKDDTIICLGDFAFNNIKEYSERLNGNKILILGNHDRNPMHSGYSSWTVIDGVYVVDTNTCKLLGYEYDKLISALIIQIDNKKYLLSHYSPYDDNQHDRANKKIVPRMEVMEKLFEYYECDYAIHGHTHSKTSSFDKSINVCVEHTEFKPKKLGDMI